MSEDHDLLIEINANVKSIASQFIKHCEDDANVQGGLSKSLGAVHRRIDLLLVSGIGGIILIVLAWLLKMNGTI